MSKRLAGISILWTVKIEGETEHPFSILCTRGYVLASLQAGHLHDHCLPGTVSLFLGTNWGWGTEGGRRWEVAYTKYVCLSRLFQSQIWLQELLNESPRRLCWIHKTECRMEWIVKEKERAVKEQKAWTREWKGINEWTTLGLIRFLISLPLLLSRCLSFIPRWSSS